MKTQIESSRKIDRRPNGMQNKINMQLRHEICNGIYATGSRLPSRAELIKYFRTSPTTIQQAFNKLTEDNFIISKGKRGTFVTNHPPCFSKYAIVFPFNIHLKKYDGTFYQILGKLAERKRRDDGAEFSLYMGLDGHTDLPDYERLLLDMRSLRLSGIIFASSPHNLENSPLFEEILARKDLPKVAFMSEAIYPSIQTISIDSDVFLKKSLKLFQSRGCRRLAILGAVSEGNETIYRESELPFKAKQMGMELNSEWIQVVHSNLASRIRQLVHLLLQGPSDRRPDALLILDSIFVEEALKGIKELGLELSKDITVVGHCNFPEPPEVKGPMTFMGYNIELFLDTCLEMMKKQKKGSLNMPLTFIPLKKQDN